MPIYRKARGRYRVVIHYGAGERKDYIVAGTKKDAERVEAQRRLELEAASRKPRRDVPTFAEFCLQEYREYAELRLRHATWRNRQSHLAFIIEVLGDVRLDRISKALVERYAQKRRRDGLRPVSVNNELRVIRNVLNVARDREIAVPSWKFKLLRDRSERVKVWSSEQVGRLLRAVREHSPDIFDLVLFLANTGTRKGEALALRWKDVDLDGRLVRITPRADWTTKSGRPREVPLNDKLVEILSMGSLSETWVFPSPKTGERYAVWPQRKFERAQKAAGLSGGPHVLRHTFASHFLQECQDMFLLAKILGHSHTRVTEIYSHLLPGHLEKARNAVSFVLDSEDE